MAPSPLARRVVPFAVFSALTSLQGNFGLGEGSRYWIYLLKTLVGAWMIWAWWDEIPECRWAFSWEAIGVGVVIFALWVGLDGLYPPSEDLLSRIGFGKGKSADHLPQPWNPHAYFGSGSVLAWLFILLRIVGTTLIVPPMEEVFYRSFLYRYLANPRWETLPLNQWNPVSFLVTSAAFGLVHNEWLPGILCGAAYQGLVLRKNRLGDAMTAHAVTNLLLGIWVGVEGRLELLVMPGTRPPPCVVFEDADLLVVNKPPGWNTHAPAPFAGEGIHEWFRHREPRWERLSIIHRLDKDTSGLLVFGKTPEANRSLTEQFARRKVHKEYVLVTDRPISRDPWVVRSSIVRDGDRYRSRPLAEGGDPAETRFRVLRADAAGTWIAAEPITGRTHQIRVHASSNGFPILGDSLYGGASAHRLHLHAGRLQLTHPRSGDAMEWEAPPEYSVPAANLLRQAIVQPDETNAFRSLQGAADGTPGRYVDHLGDWLLIEGEGQAPPESEVRRLRDLAKGNPQGVYFKALRRQVRQASLEEACPQLLDGISAPARFEVVENGLRFELSFQEGYSTGIFLDQRENRRRLKTRHVGAGFPLTAGDGSPGELLNCFSYTCGFSVAAASGGLRVTSLDLSRKYLEWGRRNFVLNGLDPAAHDFIYGDVFDWLGRLARKTRRFQVVVLDPPTFSRSREHGDFRAESDYGDLVTLALPLLAPGGVLLASTNASRLSPEAFVGGIRDALQRAGRRPLVELYVPQPPDFPITRDEPAHLKTFWCRAS